MCETSYHLHDEFEIFEMLLTLDHSTRLRKPHEQVKIYIVLYVSYYFIKINQKQLNQKHMYLITSLS